MTLVDTLVSPSEVVDLEGDALRAWLGDRYRLPGDRWVRLNLVTALGGQLAAPSGTSDDLTGGIDRTLLGTIRRSADVVLVGAGSVRAERPVMPRTAEFAIATLRGDLDPAHLPASAGGRAPIVLCAETIAGGLRARVGDAARVVAVPGDPAETPSTLIDALVGIGLPRIVCEGGAALASVLLAAGAVDEFDQTIAPLGVADGPVITARVGPAVLDGLLRDATDRLYARWRLRPR